MSGHHQVMLKVKVDDSIITQQLQLTFRESSDSVSKDTALFKQTGELKVHRTHAMLFNHTLLRHHCRQTGFSSPTAVEKVSK